VPLAHPLTHPYHLPLSPLLAAELAAALVLLAAYTWPQGARDSASAAGSASAASWAGTLSRAQIVVRTLAVVLLVLAIAAGRFGADDQLENLAPALVVGALWPLLFVASITFGSIWRWIDPWDGIARPLTRRQLDDPGYHVWPAAVIALAWVWYLGAYPDALDPRSVGTITAAYSIVALAGCLAFGRVRWLSTGEPLGIVLSWTALFPRRRLDLWQPPRGAEALLGVFAGGALFGAIRRSELWGDLNTIEDATLVASAGLLASCSLLAALLVLLARLGERQDARANVARAVVPAVVAIIVAVALDRNRLFTSVQLLPSLVGDPFGRGWDAFGEAGEGLDPAPLGERGLVFTQLGILLIGHFVGALVLARGALRARRAPAAVALTILAGVSVISVTSH
jgi:hypothetical protein